MLPIAYFTNMSISATEAKPWFDIDILYANTFQYPYDKDITAVNVVANFTITTDLVDLKEADAKIEAYKFCVYSDQGPIANMVYTFALARDIPDPNAPNGVTQAIRGWSADNWVFADNTTYNLADIIGPIDGRSGQGLGSLDGNPIVEEGWTFATVSGFLSTENGERAAQALSNLEKAQTIYIDVTRIMTITYNLQINPDSSTASTTNTLTNNEVIDSIKLAKTDFGFASGDVPDFMQGDAQFLHILPSPLVSSIFDIIQPTSQIGTAAFALRKLVV